MKKIAILGSAALVITMLTGCMSDLAGVKGGAGIPLTNPDGAMLKKEVISYLKDKKDGYSESASFGLPPIFTSTKMVLKEKDGIRELYSGDEFMGLLSSFNAERYYDKNGRVTKKRNVKANMLYGLLASHSQIARSNSFDMYSSDVLLGTIYSETSTMGKQGISSSSRRLLLGLLLRADYEATAKTAIAKESILTPLIFSRMATYDKRSQKALVSINFIANAFGWTTAGNDIYLKVLWMQFQVQ